MFLNYQDEDLKGMGSSFLWNVPSLMCYEFSSSIGLKLNSDKDLFNFEIIIVRIGAIDLYKEKNHILILAWPMSRRMEMLFHEPVLWEFTLMKDMDLG